MLVGTFGNNDFGKSFVQFFYAMYEIRTTPCIKSRPVWEE